MADYYLIDQEDDEVEKYECPECHLAYAYESSAAECCVSVEGPIYVCGECNRHYDDEEEARACCANGAILNYYECSECSVMWHTEDLARDCCSPSGTGSLIERDTEDPDPPREPTYEEIRDASLAAQLESKPDWERDLAES